MSPGTEHPAADGAPENGAPGHGEPADGTPANGTPGNGTPAPGSRPLPAHFHRGGTDSAGQPWEGRHFGEETAFAGDDGSAPDEVLEALRAFRAGEAGADAVVTSLRRNRLLIPLVAEAGEMGADVGGRHYDKSQELAIVTVEGPDGRAVLPVFTSVEAMSAWDPSARPVPATGERVALAAASEHTDLMVVDPGSETEFAVRRPALWALAQGRDWRPPESDPAIARAFRASIDRELGVLGVELIPGDPGARMAGPEVVVRLELLRGLTQTELDAILARLARRWAADETIAAGIDSLGVQLAPSAA